ncbi:MAG: hypothetical protein ABT940_10870 [Alphaproteobacteria bacterium]
MSKNPVFGVVAEVVAEHSNTLPYEFAISLPSEQWEELWRHPVRGVGGKPLARSARIRLQVGGFGVMISEDDPGDPPESEH